jgi:hypothetical protein
MSQQNEVAVIDRSIREVLKPIIYTDIFDYPLTAEEVHQFLEAEASLEEVNHWLGQAVDRGHLARRDGFYTLVDRSQLVNKRRERERASARLWPYATYYGRWIASLPFVKLVAVTGSLAVDNPRDGVDDIDYLIVTQAGRLWLCRAMIILLVRYGYRRGVSLCPNYLITENVLGFDKDFFTAREMLQMKPLYGRESYLKMRQINSWIINYFPQANGFNLEKLDDELSSSQQLFKGLGETTLGGGLGNLLEKWLQKFQITKHTRRAQEYGALDKVIFTADVCKGHYNSHSHKTMTAYQQRIEQYQ